VAFGRRLRELRLAASLSQEQLAAKADLHWTYVGGIERGERNPSLVNITRLAVALQVPPGELFEAPRYAPGRTRVKRR
jgi:transcriptional regulator with XRE-family HTH domain